MVMSIREPSPQQPPKQPPSRMDKSVSLAYSKDMVIAGKIPIDKMLFFAEVFCSYMTDDFQNAQRNFVGILATSPTTGKGA